MKLSDVIEELVEDRGLDINLLSEIVTQAIATAYEKKYPTLNLIVDYNKKSDEIKILVPKTIVSKVQDEDTEIGLRKAKTYNPDAQIGESIPVSFEKPIGRIEILKAKQFIVRQIRSIEHEIVYKEFKPKEGTIIQGVVYKCEKFGTSVKLDDVFAFLPKSLTIPNERCVVGHPIRALLKEVYMEPKHENQLILDRVSPEFLKKLFELEIPEVFEKLVEIKKIVRSAGYKSKVLVVSHDENIDPVGTCIGVSGSRIKPILREVGNEKIDIIEMCPTLEDLVKAALKPAQINRVEIEQNNAKVWLDEDQRAVAIGKNGQNINLASQLTGLNIDLVRENESNESSETA